MTKTRTSLLCLAVGLALAGCGTSPTRTTENQKPQALPPFKGGGYYKDDGPGANPPANLDEIPDATPRWEPLHRFANTPYRVLGREYVPVAADQPYKARGLASWYGRRFHGKPTSTGEPYDMYAMTAAHPTLPLPSYARVTNLENGRSVVVRVNDRGPFHEGRIIDLSYTAAYKLDVLKGVTPVEVESILPEDAPTSFSAQADAPFATPVRMAVEAATEADVGRRSTDNADRVAAGSGPAGEARSVYLQLGAFTRQDAADGLLARASTILSREFPGLLRLQSNGLHRVQAGPFSAGAQAERAAALIRAELGIQAFRVSVEAQTASATPEASPKAAAGSEPGLYLQLAALSSADAADVFAERVRSRYGDRLPGLTRISADSLFKLQAGPFASPAEAQRLAVAYQQDFGVRPYRIVR